jgi:dsDNA-specific endonuclease/ATPase MutS2
MKPHLDMDKIARGLRAERKGQSPSRRRLLWAMQLLADIEARLRVAVGGGRATDPDWTERRLVPLAPRTLKRLEAITEDVKSAERRKTDAARSFAARERRPNRSPRMK